MAFERLQQKLKENGFSVKVFETGEEAAIYLNRKIDGMTVGMGGSMTLAELGLKESLSIHNKLYRHGFTPGDPAEIYRLASEADVYILSANGIAEDTGAIINIDGIGNRISASLFGHRKVYFVAGKNKVSPNFTSALNRVRNVVAPKNAQRLKRNTPCATKADRCYNCHSPDRICRGMAIQMQKMPNMDMEVILVNQDLGY